MELTKNADKVLCVIYKIYLKRIKDGVGMEKASLFEYDFTKEDKAFTKMEESAIFMALSELGDAGYIRRYTDGGFLLNRSAVVKMENRFSDGMKEVLSYIESVFNVLPLP